jgi:hypothetical protein
VTSSTVLQSTSFCRRIIRTYSEKNDPLTWREVAPRLADVDTILLI